MATIGRVEAHLPPEGLRGLTTIASSARTTEREPVGCGIPLTGQGVNHNIVLCEDCTADDGRYPLTGQGVNHYTVLCEDYGAAIHFGVCVFIV